MTILLNTYKMTSQRNVGTYNVTAPHLFSSYHNDMHTSLQTEVCKMALSLAVTLTQILSYCPLTINQSINQSA